MASNTMMNTNTEKSYKFPRCRTCFQAFVMPFVCIWAAYMLWCFTVVKVLDHVLMATNILLRPPTTFKEQQDPLVFFIFAASLVTMLVFAFLFIYVALHIISVQNKRSTQLLLIINHLDSVGRNIGTNVSERVNLTKRVSFADVDVTVECIIREMLYLVNICMLLTLLQAGSDSGSNRVNFEKNLDSLLTQAAATTQTLASARRVYLQNAPARGKYRNSVDVAAGIMINIIQNRLECLVKNSIINSVGYVSDLQSVNTSIVAFFAASRMSQWPWSWRLYKIGMVMYWVMLPFILWYGLGAMPTLITCTLMFGFVGLMCWITVSCNDVFANTTDVHALQIYRRICASAIKFDSIIATAFKLKSIAPQLHLKEMLLIFFADSSQCLGDMIYELKETV